MKIVIIEVPKGSDILYSFRNVLSIRSCGITEVANSNVIRDMVLASGIHPIRWERRHSTADLEADL